MEPHTNALEVVCRHFKQEYGTEALLKLRREKTVWLLKIIGCVKKVKTWRYELGICWNKIKAYSLVIASLSCKCIVRENR